MKIFAHIQYGAKAILLFSSVNVGGLNLHIKHNTKCETVAKI